MTLVKASIDQEQLAENILKEAKNLRQRQHHGRRHVHRHVLDLELDKFIPLISTMTSPSPPTIPRGPCWDDG